ncbi:MAG: amidohydrolase family protein [Candidatus Neomarinimicrobiota bacterium]
MPNNQTQPETTEPINGYTARWVVPVSQPPIERGVIIVKGEQIIEVASADQLRTNIDGSLIDLGESIIFPGLVNAHTHLEHPVLPESPANFIKYIGFQQNFYTQANEADLAVNASANLKDCIAFGTVAVADFSARGASYPALSENPVFARLFFEINGFKNHQAGQIIRTYRELIKDQSTARRVTQHLAPSSVWSLSPQLFREISLSERHIAIHMGLLPDENDFTLNGTGLMRQILLAREDFDFSWQVPGLSAIRYFFSNHFYARHNILTHLTHVTAEEIDFIKEFGVKVNVCLCPRSSKIFSDTKAPVGMLLEKGINLCLGTESRALVPDLDVRKEMIACVDSYGVSPESALKFATLNGAYAIGFHKEVGSLETGKTARCLVLDCSDMAAGNPHEMILSASQAPRWLI